MAQKRKTEQSRIVEAALALAARDGWEAITAAQLAKRARVAESRAPDGWGALALALEFFDTESIAAACGNGREALFEILMTRFERMQAQRAACLKILPALVRNPLQAPALACRLGGFLGAALAASGLSDSPPRRAALGAVYAAGYEAWRRDESRDLGITMAAVDKALGRMAKALVMNK